ncbi:MAG: hypothetical protein N2B03_09335, partial [Boseongicola sp.]
MSEFGAGFRNAMRLTRSDVFGAQDEQCPISEPSDAHVPQMGFVGEDYAKGGVVLLAINPGGGGDSYRRTSEDSILLPKIELVRSGSGKKADFQEMCSLCSANMQTWNLWRIVKPVLDACDHLQSEIC